MLTELELTGFGVVEHACLELGPGLTALTGETGAGKTMIVSGLGHLLGARGDAGVVRSGAQRAVVQGRWMVPSSVSEDVRELGGDVDDDDELVTLRQVSAQGRSRAVVGGAQVPVSALASLLADLATIHGQQGQTMLSLPERQRELLDSFARPRGLQHYRSDYNARREAAAELDRLRQEEATRAREMELLQFGLDEVGAVEPLPEEDVQLAAEAVRLQDADELRRLAAETQMALSGPEDDFDAPGAVGLLGQARKLAASLAERDSTAQELATQVAEATYLVEEVASAVAGYAAGLVADPARLEAVTERRAALATLTRKYGETLAEVLDWATQAASRLGELQGSDERIAQLEARVAELDERLVRSAATITEDRQKAAGQLAEEVRAELAALAMPHARVEFQITPADLGPHGADRIELMFSANPGSALAPLSKVASGGELSRVRLALEVVLAGQAGGHTFVFDEVDAGVGGAVGLEIGRRLKRLANSSQVIVVTHLAQVAAFADAHFVVSKSSDGGVTTSDVTKLSDDERAAEIARMMGGSASSDVALKHAVELLDQGRASTSARS